MTLTQQSLLEDLLAVDDLRITSEEDDFLKDLDLHWRERALDLAQREKLTAIAEKVELLE